MEAEDEHEAQTGVTPINLLIAKSMPCEDLSCKISIGEVPLAQAHFPRPHT